MTTDARTRRLRALQAEWVYLDSTINDPAARIYGDCARELLAVLDTEGDRPDDSQQVAMLKSLLADARSKSMLSLHRCTICGTRWLLWPDTVHGGGWNLLDKWQQPGSCCNNAAMEQQIEHLREIPLFVSRADTEGGRQPCQHVWEKQSAGKECRVCGVFEGTAYD
jgi:hypothetical protein